MPVSSEVACGSKSIPYTVSDFDETAVERDRLYHRWLRGELRHQRRAAAVASSEDSLRGKSFRPGILGANHFKKFALKLQKTLPKFVED